MNALASSLRTTWLHAALAGYPLGLHFRFLDPSPEGARWPYRIEYADFNDEPALKNFRMAWKS